jgi:methyltransferase (TIGR00027 family)
MGETLIRNVSDTAFWIAHYRAIETERPDALFRDPLARILAGDRGKDIAKTMPVSFWTRWSVVIRTCIIDDYLQSAVADGVETILNLGAGLDTRPYRMALPQSLVWIEADYPQVIEYKQEKLLREVPHCRLERVKLNLANENERRNLFAKVGGEASKLAVLTEGVTPYLSDDEVSTLAHELRGLDCARYWVVDYFSPEIVKYRERSPMVRKMQNAPFRFAPKDWFAFFSERGWHLVRFAILGKRAFAWDGR